MNNKIFYIAITGLLVIIAILSTLLFVKTKEDKKESYTNNTIESIKDNNNSIEEIKEDKKETTKTSTSSTNTNTKTNNNTKSETKESTKTEEVISGKVEAEKVYTSKDKTVIENLENIYDKTKEVLNSEPISTGKEKAKGIFITLVDFVFYDGEIKGITLDELSENGKEKALEIISKIDTAIENKYPDYKDGISESAKEAFKKASEIIKNSAKKISNFSKEKLGDENYQAIINAKEEIVKYTKKAASIVKDFSINIYNKTTSKLKEWYENLRNS